MADNLRDPAAGGPGRKSLRSRILDDELARDWTLGSVRVNRAKLLKARGDVDMHNMLTMG